MPDPNLALLNGAVAFFLPLIISVILQAGWSVSVKSLVSFGLCVIAALLTSYVTGHFDTINIGASLFIVFTAAKTLYETLYKPMGVAPAIELSTSVDKG